MRYVKILELTETEILLYNVVQSTMVDGMIYGVVVEDTLAVSKDMYLELKRMKLV